LNQFSSPDEIVGHKLEGKRLDTSLTKIRETKSTDQRYYEMKRLKHTSTEENMTIVDERVGLLSRKTEHKQTTREIYG